MGFALRCAPLLLAWCWLPAAGCSNVWVAFDGSIGTFDGLRVGETRYGEALDRLGAPARVAADGDGFALLYGSMRFSESQFFLRYRVLQFATSDGDNHFAYAVLRFDRDGVLREARRIEGDMDIGRGILGGPAQAQDPFFGSADYTQAIPVALLWGRDALRRLPRTLNPSGDIEYGEGGLELPFTPTGAGQQTLSLEPGERDRR